MKSLYMGASALVLTAMMASQAFAQAAAPTGEEANVEAVVVTGTRTTGLRAVDSAAPVQVLGQDVLKRVGQPDLVQSLAQSIPSIQAQAQGSDEAAFNLSFKLRSLSPNETLVLVDGKRRHGTANVNVAGGPYGGGAAPDLNFISAESIDHIEVLTDGAAAQYGTDAIAGVINIILKKNTHGGNLTLTSGQNFDGGNLTGDIAGTVGFAPNDKSFLDLSFESKFKGVSFRGDIDPRVLNVNGKTPIPGYPNGYTSPSNVSTNLLNSYPLVTGFPNYPYVNRIGGSGQLRLDTFTYNSGYELTPEISLYSFGTAGFKDGKAYENYRLPNVVLSSTGVPAFPAGFAPMENIRETDYSATVGAKGSIKDTTWDLSSTYGRNYDRVYVLGSANAAYYKDYTANPAAATLGVPQTNFHDGDFTATQWANNLDLTHAFNVGLSEPIVLAGGAEYRIESYQLKAGDPQSYYASPSAGGGAQSFFGYAPSNAGYHQREAYAFYADVALSPIKKLKLDGAVRYEDYSDFGNTTVFKGTGRYDFTDSFALRGTASTGFRAPTLAEEFYSGINVGPTSVSGVFAPNSAGAKLLGAGGLGPEKSTNYSVGVVTHFLPSLTMTLDAYAIKITNRIVQSGSFYGYYGASSAILTSPSVIKALTASGVPIDPAILTLSNGLPNPAGSVSIQTFVNGVDTQTYGIDYLATYPVDYGAFGHVDYSLSANYNDTHVTRIAPPPSNINQSVKLLDQAAVSLLEDSTPKFRATFGAFWTKGKFSVNVKESFYGSSFTYATNTVSNAAAYVQLKVNEAAITDLDLAYEVIKNVKVSVGANNLLNTYPNKNPLGYRQGQLTSNSSNYANASSVYPNTGPYGYEGGFYYGKISWTF